MIPGLVDVVSVLRTRIHCDRLSCLGEVLHNEGLRLSNIKLNECYSVTIHICIIPWIYLTTISYDITMLQIKLRL